MFPQTGPRPFPASRWREWSESLLAFRCRSSLSKIDTASMEALIHRVLEAVRFDVEIPDRFGKPVRPREWFLVPLPVVDEIVARIADGTLAGMTSDVRSAALVPIGS
ncbi:GIY-YIG nuclease family protein [uncultured Sphingomonas sp.]|uniref:GIY-YIG nuclease family protein n=1 Tax=uncultured Sphingomonas sp. TaxID=158754 RepID=UPI0025D7CA9F|nr:GIY-YIG nuclease family protein [uncultured Sphingomonas sp.]